MLEYGIKTITINPTLITKATEIIKLVDNRTSTTRAFVLPASYAHYIKKIEKEIEYKKWVKEKKKQLKNLKQSDNLEDISIIGLSSVNDYLGDN